MTFVLVDILPLKSGKSVDDAIAYFNDIRPVLERHGLVRIDAPLKALKTLRGAQTANLVNLFATENVETSMKGMQGDPEYQARIPVRDALFDLENSSVILTRRDTAG